MGLKKRRQLGIYGSCLRPDMLGKILRIHRTCDHANVAIAIGNGITNDFFGEFVGCSNEDGLLTAKLWMCEEVSLVSPCLHDRIERDGGCLAERQQKVMPLKLLE